MAFTITYEGDQDDLVASSLLRGLVGSEHRLTVDINDAERADPDTITGRLISVDQQWFILEDRNHTTRASTMSVLDVTIHEKEN